MNGTWSTAQLHTCPSTWSHFQAPPSPPPAHLPAAQILYFTPALRNALLKHIPEPDSEFCLACELGLLFRWEGVMGG